MAHEFNHGSDCCEHCWTRRHYIAEIGKYVYTSADGRRSFDEPKCTSDRELREGGQYYSLLWEVVVFLVICVGIYFLAMMVQQRREQQRIEEYHSHIAPATANDTL